MDEEIDFQAVLNNQNQGVHAGVGCWKDVLPKNDFALCS